MADKPKALPELDAEDRRKLHAEVNQIVNQRLWLTTVAIGFFTTVTGWSITHTPSSPSDLRFRFLLSALLLGVLFLLFLYSHFLKRMLRTFSVYLREKRASRWEHDWNLFRKYRSAEADPYRYFGYTKAQTIVYLFLGAVSALNPLAAWLTDRSVTLPWVWLAGTLVLGVAYLVAVFAMGIHNWRDHEEEVQKRWREVLSNAERGT